MTQNTYDRSKLILHARSILDSGLSGTQIARMTGISRHQIYHYRSGYRKIARAQLETLLKFQSIAL